MWQESRIHTAWKPGFPPSTLGPWDRNQVVRLGGKPVRHAHPVPLCSPGARFSLPGAGSFAVPRARPKPGSPGRASPGSPCRTASSAPQPTCRLPPSGLPPGLRFPPASPNRPPSSARYSAPPPPKQLASSTRPPGKTPRPASAHARPGYYMATTHFRCRPHLASAPPSGIRARASGFCARAPPL